MWFFGFTELKLTVHGGIWRLITIENYVHTYIKLISIKSIIISKYEYISAFVN